MLKRFSYKLANFCHDCNTMIDEPPRLENKIEYALPTTRKVFSQDECIKRHRRWLTNHLKLYISQRLVSHQPWNKKESQLNTVVGGSPIT